jgi:hypothetical protein
MKQELDATFPATEKSRPNGRVFFYAGRGVQLAGQN